MRGKAPDSVFAAVAGGPEEHARHAVAAGSRTLTQIPTPEIFPAPGQQLGPSNIRTLPPDYSPGFETPRAGLPRLYKRVQHTVSSGPEWVHRCALTRPPEVFHPVLSTG